DQAPTEIVLEFNNEPLDTSSAIIVTDSDGETVADGEPLVEGRSVSLPIEEPLVGGEHEVQWRVVSSDGHPIEGTFSFTVPESAGPTEAPADNAATEEEPPADPSPEAESPGEVAADQEADQGADQEADSAAEPTEDIAEEAAPGA